MKSIINLIKLTLPVLVLSVHTATAQKLPNKQDVSVFAPSNIKIDGKTTEWNDTFKAYNNATDTYYTLANDDKNLYLVVRAKYRNIIDKILRGSVTLSVSPTTDKKDPKSVSVTYPVLYPEVGVLTNAYARKHNEQEESKGAPVNTASLNELYAARQKVIIVKGIDGITDEEMPIYNTEGIKTGAFFDDKLNYTFELAIPLKHLKLPDSSPFSYHIKVNEQPTVKRTGGGGSIDVPPPMMATDMVSTDFWGEYTLAKR
ncbi:hypothetical protein [Mucilaginibacter antarcticus]|uniref:Uncharacterized protein n=1 Tax=Mucilaginibacter antarcticus TaxID=1855725 RepID=A0ABW5XML9_9SPHI